MIKRFYLLSMIACAAMCTSLAMAETRSVTFDFSTAEAIEAWGLPVPTTGNPTYLQGDLIADDIRLVPGSSSPTITFYKNQYTFYSRSGQSFKFVADNGALITRIDFDGFYSSQNFNSSPAGFDSSRTYWSGSASEVTLTGTSGNSLFSMTVTYEVESPSYSPLDVNQDGSITASDVTALYNYIIYGDNTYVATSDVNGDGSITASDVTMVYNYILFGIEPEIIEPPTFSHPSGTVFYTPTVVTVTGTAGSRVYVTTDGSIPTTSNYEDNAYGSINITVGFSMVLKAIAVVDGKSSAVVTAIYTLEQIVDNNTNANWKESGYNIPQSGITATSSSATYNQAWRMEYPHISTSNNNMVVVHATSQYGITYSLELDKSQRANRWTCFTMHNGTPDNNVGRTTSTFSTDECVPSAYQVQTSEYTSGKYTTQVPNDDGTNMVLFARGHICASEDRQSSEEQNRQTFITSNIHPQYQAHNAGLWGTMESVVQSWGKSSSFRDTLYVCKGATIANVTLDGTTASGTIPYSEVKSKYGVTLTGSLTIPRYWFMALLCLKNGEYHAMAYWTEQKNTSNSGTTLPQCMISIDELERRTGIDFFCNLPDDIEEEVEATVDTTFWRILN